MNDTIKNLLVGLFVMSAVVILVGTIMFLKPSIGDGKQTLYVRFSDIGNINIGTRVLFAGKPVGEVVAMEEIHDPREQPTDELGRVYFYQLTLHVDSGVKVYNTDEISIQSAGFLGEKSISITPKAPPKGVTPQLISELPVYADCVDSFQTTLLNFSGLSTTMQETFRGVNNWIRSHGEEVATTIRAGGAALEEIDQTFASLNQTELVKHVQKGVCEINAALAAMEEKQTFQNAGCIIESIKTTCSDIADGKGTLGRLVNDSDLYLQSNAILTKANTFMNDLNQYGILFHLNKQWQRMNLQKVSRINALDTPQSFKNYFEKEVGEINGAMTRISMLIQKAELSPDREQILKSEQFKRDFAELLRRTDELSDNLKLYNQQLSEAAGP